jgi:hypothetical protein
LSHLNDGEVFLFYHHANIVEMSEEYNEKNSPLKQTGRVITMMTQ